MKSYPFEIRFAFRKHMIINREFEPLLQRNGLDDFDAVMRFTDGEIVKQLTKERSTVRFRIPDGNGTIQMYLKRYRNALVPSFLKQCFFFFKTYSAIHEWRNILAFQDVDLPTMTPVAVGMRRRIPFGNESFLLTLGIPQVMTLEKNVHQDFMPPLSSAQRRQKRVLIERLAALARRMHEAGFKHQDFYLCHILIDLSDPDDPLLYIADLHRVKKKNITEKRWRIKDLAALNFSAPEKIVSRTERLRFLTTYDPRLADDKAFVRAILRKTERIRRHAAKKGD